MNSSIKYLFSIIIPVYNREKCVLNAINSILRQTYVDFELIIVDDGSTDSSGLICDKSASSDNRIKVFHQKNEGVSAARNNALTKCKGDYVLFCDSDDEFDCQVLQRLHDIILSSESPDVVVFGYKNTDNSCFFLQIRK